MSSKTIVVLGALSAIGEATARIHAARGDRLVLAGRNGERLERLKSDLLVRGAAGCETVSLDLATETDAAARLAAMTPEGGTMDAVYLFYGLLGDQRRDERDLDEARKILDVNFTSAAAWCLAAANRLEAQDSGVLIAISSVAGDRGRQSNYIYGAAKAGMTTLVQGLAHRLAKGKARAVAVKLGFVDTPMTAHIDKGGPLWAKPDQIAQALVSICDKPGAPVVYLPWFWRPIMTIVKSVPASIFHRTKL